MKDITINVNELFALVKELRELKQRIEPKNNKSILLRYKLSTMEGVLSSILEHEGIDSEFKMVNKIKTAVDKDDWEKIVVDTIKELNPK